ncbi:MAG: PfkB family carbohydrate kinase [Armatimonadota bacterium]|nr:PfkB family carbohydrate kinase [Armatimonadota bacterium]MDR7430658.1 PfkB family carbohydrate kinase [Armatimonadota bacterium]MDR7579024.1 PfkB family carbohydrate kinase [Armatimonadota bacterium]MDR7581700.1 PfkB family carbohydrate kinase [Armatimonadota bacterium]MDR7596091.1 PfkB family carbohydrate kinase [Armatimonadota bacterium]
MWPVRRPVVLALGGANLDVLAHAESLRPRESNPGRVHLRPGGAARNVAENLSRLGARVHLVCAAGQDLLWERVLAPTRDAGVVVHPVPVGGQPDSYVALAEDGERAWAVSDMRACEALRSEHLIEALRACGPVDAVVADANLTEPVLAALVQVLAPRCLLTVSPAKAPRLRGRLQGTWLLACAAPEAAVLSGLEIRSPQEALRAGDRLRGAGCERVVVTLGAQGLVWCGQEEVFVPSPQVTVADATGAGDAVAACAVFALLAGYPDEEAAQLCAWAGALTVQVEGATNPKLSFEVLCELAGVAFRG